VEELCTVEFMQTTDARKLPPKTRENIRRLAVQAVLNGKTQVETAELFGVSRVAIWKWLKAYQQDGEQALQARPQGRPTGRGKLKGFQAAWMVRVVRGKCPDQLRLPFALWTREAVGALIERKFGVSLALSTIGRYLRNWGFSPQKPSIACEQNRAQVQYWLQTKYPAIKQQAKAAGARIYWGDKMGLRSDHPVGRTWGVKGEAPVVKVPGKRFSCNMISAITNLGNLNFMVFEGRFNSKIFIDFMSRLARQNEGPVFLIVDGHPVHRTRVVRDWIEERKESIRLFFLPGFSPELNPDELLNQYIKSNSVGRRRAKDKVELVNNVGSYLRSRQRRPSIVQKHFHGQHVLYPA
jgi:transposase